MDVEKTMLFILDSQRKAELRADRADRRADQAERRMDRFDEQLQATARLVTRGIKLVDALVKSQVDLRKAQKETDQKLNALIDSQLRTEEQLRKTDEKLNRFLEGLRRRNGNGHKN